MTYFGFLARFLLAPILLLGLVAWLDYRRGRPLPAPFGGFPLWAAVAINVLLALAYTTLWDNYLVASGVWSYDPDLVTGVTIGWVPIEEYTFFVLQPILAGLWLAFLLRRWRFEGAPPGPRWRWIPLAFLGLVWLASVALLAASWAPGTYLGLILVWALPPIMLQVAFGGDILARHWRFVATVILTVTLYLGLADFLAIGSGTWTINPAQSLPWLIGGVLPVEEVLFFLLTDTLVVFGVILLLSQDGRSRGRDLGQNLRQRLAPRRREVL